MSAPLLVADSGPLIALARVALLHLPASLYSQVFVPAVVWEEVLRQPPDEERVRLRAALDAGHLEVTPDPLVPAQPLADPRLGAGERAAIALAQARGAQVLVDERRGRRAAAEAGLAVVGTLGLLVRGRQLGLIGPVRPMIEALRRSGYHLSEALTARALSALGE
jgi:predicted nucleic acid-binding protein